MLTLYILSQDYIDTSDRLQGSWSKYITSSFYRPTGMRRPIQQDFYSLFQVLQTVGTFNSSTCGHPNSSYLLATLGRKANKFISHKCRKCKQFETFAEIRYLKGWLWFISTNPLISFEISCTELYGDQKKNANFHSRSHIKYGRYCYSFHEPTILQWHHAEINYIEFHPHQ